MVAAYPLVATIGAAVNITMVTYDGQAYIGVSADDRAVSDLDDLVEDLRAGLRGGDRGHRSVPPIATPRRESGGAGRHGGRRGRRSRRTDTRSR